MVMRKRCSSGRVSLIGSLTFPVGKSVIKFVKEKPFLVLGVENSISNCWKIMIHRANLPVIGH